MGLFEWVAGAANTVASWAGGAASAASSAVGNVWSGGTSAASRAVGGFTSGAGNFVSGGGRVIGGVVDRGAAGFSSVFAGPGGSARSGSGASGFGTPVSAPVRVESTPVVGRQPFHVMGVNNGPVNGVPFQDIFGRDTVGKPKDAYSAVKTESAVAKPAPSNIFSDFVSSGNKVFSQLPVLDVVNKIGANPNQAARTITDSAISLQNNALKAGNSVFTFGGNVVKTNGMNLLAGTTKVVGDTGKALSGFKVPDIGTAAKVGGAAVLGPLGLPVLGAAVVGNAVKNNGLKFDFNSVMDLGKKNLSALGDATSKNLNNPVVRGGTILAGPLGIPILAAKTGMDFALKSPTMPWNAKPAPQQSKPAGPKSGGADYTGTPLPGAKDTSGTPGAVAGPGDDFLARAKQDQAKEAGEYQDSMAGATKDLKMEGDPYAIKWDKGDRYDVTMTEKEILTKLKQPGLSTSQRNKLETELDHIYYNQQRDASEFHNNAEKKDIWTPWNPYEAKADRALVKSEIVHQDMAGGTPNTKFWKEAQNPIYSESSAGGDPYLNNAVNNAKNNPIYAKFTVLPDKAPDYDASVSDLIATLNAPKGNPALLGGVSNPYVTGEKVLPKDIQTLNLASGALSGVGSPSSGKQSIGAPTLPAFVAGPVIWGSSLNPTGGTKADAMSAQKALVEKGYSEEYAKFVTSKPSVTNPLDVVNAIRLGGGEMWKSVSIPYLKKSTSEQILAGGAASEYDRAFAAAKAAGKVDKEGNFTGTTEEYNDLMAKHASSLAAVDAYNKAYAHEQEVGLEGQQKAAMGGLPNFEDLHYGLYSNVLSKLPGSTNINGRMLTKEEYSKFSNAKSEKDYNSGVPGAVIQTGLGVVGGGFNWAKSHPVDVAVLAATPAALETVGAKGAALLSRTAQGSSLASKVPGAISVAKYLNTPVMRSIPMVSEAGVTSRAAAATKVGLGALGALWVKGGAEEVSGYDINPLSPITGGKFISQREKVSGLEAASRLGAFGAQATIMGIGALALSPKIAPGKVADKAPTSGKGPSDSGLPVKKSPTSPSGGTGFIENVQKSFSQTIDRFTNRGGRVTGTKTVAGKATVTEASTPGTPGVMKGSPVDIAKRFGSPREAGPAATSEKVAISDYLAQKHADLVAEVKAAGQDPLDPAISKQINAAIQIEKTRLERMSPIKRGDALKSATSFAEKQSTAVQNIMKPKAMKGSPSDLARFSAPSEKGPAVTAEKQALSDYLADYHGQLVSEARAAGLEPTDPAISKQLSSAVKVEEARLKKLNPIERSDLFKKTASGVDSAKAKNFAAEQSARIKNLMDQGPAKKLNKVEPERGPSPTREQWDTTDYLSEYHSSLVKEVRSAGKDPLSPEMSSQLRAAVETEKTRIKKLSPLERSDLFKKTKSMAQSRAERSFAAEQSARVKAAMEKSPMKKLRAEPEKGPTPTREQWDTTNYLSEYHSDLVSEIKAAGRDPTSPEMSSGLRAAVEVEKARIKKLSPLERLDLFKKTSEIAQSKTSFAAEQSARVQKVMKGSQADLKARGITSQPEKGPTPTQAQWELTDYLARKQSELAKELEASGKDLSDPKVQKDLREATQLEKDQLDKLNWVARNDVIKGRTTFEEAYKNPENRIKKPASAPAKAKDGTKVTHKQTMKDRLSPWKPKRPSSPGGSGTESGKGGQVLVSRVEQKQVQQPAQKLIPKLEAPKLEQKTLQKVEAKTKTETKVAVEQKKKPATLNKQEPVVLYDKQQYDGAFTEHQVTWEQKLAQPQKVRVIQSPVQELKRIRGQKLEVAQKSRQEQLKKTELAQKPVQEMIKIGQLQVPKFDQLLRTKQKVGLEFAPRQMTKLEQKQTPKLEQRQRQTTEEITTVPPDVTYPPAVPPTVTPVPPTITPVEPVPEVPEPVIPVPPVWPPGGGSGDGGGGAGRGAQGAYAFVEVMGIASPAQLISKFTRGIKKVAKQGPLPPTSTTVEKALASSTPEKNVIRISTPKVKIDVIPQSNGKTKVKIAPKSQTNTYKAPNANFGSDLAAIARRNPLAQKTPGRETPPRKSRSK